MNRAYFFRNIDTYQKLKELTDTFDSIGARKQKFKIIDTIYLNKDEFEEFQSNFIKTRDFIKLQAYKLNMNLEAEYECLLIKNDYYRYGFLVNSNGYSYARTIAIIELGEDI